MPRLPARNGNVPAFQRLAFHLRRTENLHFALCVCKGVAISTPEESGNLQAISATGKMPSANRQNAVRRLRASQTWVKRLSDPGLSVLWLDSKPPLTRLKPSDGFSF